MCGEYIDIHKVVRYESATYIEWVNFYCWTYERYTSLSLPCMRERIVGVLESVEVYGSVIIWFINQIIDCDVKTIFYSSMDDH
jgi:hypothetical protein